ncbi:MAG: hypothetical protein JXQ75_10785 [Phycisphaerae bacterium]|nr:hypothetical protein [Phycisphaerae bacterium]
MFLGKTVVRRLYALCYLSCKRLDEVAVTKAPRSPESLSQVLSEAS